MYHFQVLFIKWVLTIFDMIDAKDQLRAVYGFIFSFVTEENLVCCSLKCGGIKSNVFLFINYSLTSLDYISICISDLILKDIPLCL